MESGEGLALARGGVVNSRAATRVAKMCRPSSAPWLGTKDGIAERHEEMQVESSRPDRSRSRENCKRRWKQVGQIRRAQTIDRRTPHRRAERCPDLEWADRDRSAAGARILSRRGLSSGILSAEPGTAVLPGGHFAESGQVSQAVRRQAAHLRRTRLMTVHRRVGIHPNRPLGCRRQVPKRVWKAAATTNH